MDMCERNILFTSPPNYESKNKGMSLEKENKKLRKRNEELECIKEFQQDLIAEFERVTGKELSKKFLPGYLSDEIQKRKKKLSKRSISTKYSG